MLPDARHKNFPTALRERRHGLKLTQSEVGQRAHISGLMIGRYERGVSAPSHTSWNALNDVLYGSNAERLAHRAHPNTSSSALGLDAIPADELVAELKRRGATAVTVVW